MFNTAAALGSGLLGNKLGMDSKQRELDEMTRKYQEATSQPGMAQFNSVLGADNNIADQYKMNLDTSNLDKGMGAVRERALGTGRSGWANLMLQQQNQDSQNALGQANKDSLSSMQQAQSALAQRGGLSSGAAERLAGSSQKNMAMARLNANNQAAQGRMKIGLQDENQRMQMLQALPGMETQALQPKMAQQQFNIGNSLKGVESQNQNNQQVYGEKMKAWAANRQADATERSGKK